MHKTIKTQHDLALEYVKRVGIIEAKQSNHYLTALRHCKCKECFCCQVKSVVDKSFSER